MRFSFLALAGLAVFSNVNARAVPNALTLSKLSLREVDEYADPRKSFVIARSPLDPVEVTPEPVTPEPVTPEPVTPEPVVPEPVVPEPVTPEVTTPETTNPETTTPETNPGAEITETLEPDLNDPNVKEDPTQVTDDNPCGIVAGAKVKRAERVPDDATKWRQIVLWLKENGIQRENLVFYAGGTTGSDMAKAFIDAPENKAAGYTYFWDIFGDKFKADFGGVVPDDAVNVACSIAYGYWARGTVRVFNAMNGMYNDHVESSGALLTVTAADSSYWNQYEKPMMNKVEDIWHMTDNTLDAEAVEDYEDPPETAAIC